MLRRSLSIRRLSLVFIAMLVVITLIASVAGLVVLRNTYKSAADRFEIEAATTLRNAAVMVRNQLQFYRHITQLIAENQEIVDLLEFGDAAEIMKWGLSARAILPGSLGTALADRQGRILGDARTLRVGEVCEEDIAKFAAGEEIPYPPVHREVAGLEHFDLFTRIDSLGGEVTGLLFISFRFDVLDRLLNEQVNGQQRYILRDSDGELISSTPSLETDAELRRFQEQIPETSWTLVLELPGKNPLAFYVGVIVTDLAALAAATALILFLIGRLMKMFTADIQRIHNTLLDVDEGVFSPSREPPAIKEFESLLPDIEALAVKLQERQAMLEQQSITDPLTGLYNRRYFDILLNHDLRQSDRASPAHLVIIDLNEFKRVNDENGHHIGDQVLKEIAKFLQISVRSTDTVARLGGDEFALLLHNIEPDDIGEWGERFTGQFERYRQDPEHTVCAKVGYCTLSIGIARVDVEFYESTQEIMMAADRAMYQAKHSSVSGNRVFVCETSQGVP